MGVRKHEGAKQQRRTRVTTNQWPQFLAQPLHRTFYTEDAECAEIGGQSSRRSATSVLNQFVQATQACLAYVDSVHGLRAVFLTLLPGLAARCSRILKTCSA